MFDRCPGTKDLTDPNIIVRTCPECDEEVEFLSYENETKCYKCGKLVHREASPSCVAWCKHADKCIKDLEDRKIITADRAEELRKAAKTMKTEK